MCGIFATISQTDQTAAQTILQGLKTLEYRGYDSWGISILDQSGELQTEKHVGKIGRAQTKLSQSSIGLGHTRWATHGGVTVENAHPHLDCHHHISLIHNGIVDNYQELKASLLEQGHKFHSETDTEVIVHLIEKFAQKHDFPEACRLAFKQLEGANAILALDSLTQSLVAIKTSSPLLVAKSNDGVFFSSDATAFIPHSNQIYIMVDGDMIIAQRDQIKRVSFETGKELPLTFLQTDLSSRAIDKGKYPFFLLKEIHEQPEIIEKLSQVDFSEHSHLLDAISRASEVFFIGCGSAYHCCLLGTYFFNQAQMLSFAFQAHEFVPFTKQLKPNSLVIAISQSGETIDTILACEAAKKAGAKLVGIVNARGSSLERLVDITFPVGAGPEIAVVSTKAFIAQVCSLFLIAEKLQTKQLHKPSQALLNLAQSMKTVLDNTQKLEQIKQLAKQLWKQEHIFIIGKGLNFPAAMELSLKIKETALIHAEAFAAGELKHGVLILIEPGISTIVLTNHDEVQRDTFSNALEIKARGGNLISFSPDHFDQANDEFILNNLGPLNAVLNIVIAQVLSYEIAILKKLDPDKPRNLAKSVTVK